MTTYNKASLKAFFQDGDIPTGSDYSNFIDSYVNLVETTEQAMAGALSTTELVTPKVSATTINATGTITANKVIAPTVSGDTTFGGDITVSGATNLNGFLFSNILTSINGTCRILCNVTAPAVDIFTKSIRISDVAIVSAAGTTQGAAAVLTSTINRLQGIADGTTTGFAIPSNKPGLIQYIVNETNVSANLWPPTGGIINNLGANTVFPIAAGASYTIFHTRASAYGVK